MPKTKGQGNPDWTADETILALDLLLQHLPRVPGKDDPAVRELSSVLRTLPIHPVSARKPSFRNPDGVALKLQNLLAASDGKLGHRGLAASATDRKVWSTYAQRPTAVRQLAKAILDGVRQLSADGDDRDDAEHDDGLPEGEILTRLHRKRERKSQRVKLVRKRRATNTLRCEACLCEPRLKSAGPGPEEAEFEAHHILPLASSGARATRLSDLALLCANCHRLIHALMRSTRTHQSIADLQQSLKS